jgi:hypothetical protein
MIYFYIFLFKTVFLNYEIAPNFNNLEKKSDSLLRVIINFILMSLLYPSKIDVTFKIII